VPWLSELSDISPFPTVSS
jgi:hypothetical protein